MGLAVPDCPCKLQQPEHGKCTQSHYKNKRYSRPKAFFRTSRAKPRDFFIRWQGCPAAARGRCREFYNDSNVVDRVEQCTSVDEPLAETAATTACNIEQNRAGSVGESASVRVGSAGSRARAVG